MLITSDKTIPIRFSPAELENLRLLCLKSQSVLAAQGDAKQPEKPAEEETQAGHPAPAPASQSTTAKTAP